MAIGKNSMFFSIDALIGAMVLIGGIIAASNYYINTQSTANLNVISSDILNSLGEVRVSEVNSTYVSLLVSQGNITRVNNTILEQIGEFWANGNRQLATNLSREFLQGFSGNYGYGLFIDGVQVWSNDVNGSKNTISSFKLISGIAENKSAKGFVARATALGLSGNNTDVFVFNPEGSGFDAGAAKKAIITKRVYLNFTNLTSSVLYISMHAGSSGVGNQNKVYINSHDLTGSMNWIYEDQPAMTTNTKISFGNVSVTNYVVNGWNNITLELFGQNNLHTHLHPGGRLEVTYVKNKEYIPLDSVIKRTYFDQIDGFGGAWAIMPIEIPQGTSISDVTFSLRAKNIDNKPAAQIPVQNKYNVQVYLDNQAIDLSNPDSSGNVNRMINLTSRVHEGTNVLSVYLNCYGDINWGNSDVKTIMSTPEYAIGYLKKETQMETELASLGAVAYRKSSNSETNAFLSNLNNYALVVIEDGHLTAAQMNSIDSYVRNGGIAFLSEHVLLASGSMLNVTYTYRANNGYLSSVIFSDSILQFSAGQNLIFSEQPTINGSMTIIANHSDNTVAIANWTYGKGQVYYFSDFQESVLDSDYRAKVRGAIQRLIPALNSTYIEVRYSDLNRKRLQWGKLHLSKAENIGGAKALSKIFKKNISDEYVFTDSFIGLAQLDSNTTFIRVNGNQEYYTPKPYGTTTNIFVDPEHLTNSENSINITDTCPACFVLPETTFHYSILIPAAVGYGGTFATLDAARQDAKNRLITALGSYATYTSINENNSMILSNVPSMWGPALVELRVWN